MKQLREQKDRPCSAEYFYIQWAIVSEESWAVRGVRARPARAVSVHFIGALRLACHEG